MFTITITDPSKAQAEAVFAAYFAHQQGDAAPAEDAPKPTRTRATKPKAEEPAPTPEQEEEQAQPDVNDEAEAPAEEEQEAGPTKEECEAALRKLVGANGRDAAAEALGKFNATNLSTLKEKDYAKFIAHCEKAAK